MTDAEAVYTAQEAADKLTECLESVSNMVECMDNVPLGDVSRHLDKISGDIYCSLSALAEVKFALSKIKVRETA